MFSIIIPTLLINKYIINKLITELICDEVVGEIIVIDNSLQGFKFPSEKVRVITPPQNMFVNPSWNLGIKESKYEKFGILNDDILIPQNFCSDINIFLENNNCGLIGLDSDIDQVTEDFNDYPPVGLYSCCPLKDNLDIGFWGAGFFGRKENYSDIPEEMKIYCGDNYLLLKNCEKNLINYKIIGAQIKHFGSASSGNKEFNKIKNMDREYYQKYDTVFDKLENRRKNVFLNFLQNIFSIKNEMTREGKIKVIKILFFQYKFKTKQKTKKLA